MEINLDNYSMTAEIEGTQQMSLGDSPEEEISWGSVNVDETVQIVIWDNTDRFVDGVLQPAKHVANVYVRNEDDETIWKLCVEEITKYEEGLANGGQLLREHSDSNAVSDARE